MKNSFTKIASAFCLLMAFSGMVHAQVGINNVNPNNAAVLDLGGTDRGFLLPRLTEAQRGALPSPVQGLMIYDTGMDMPYYYRPSNSGPYQWQLMTPFLTFGDSEFRSHSAVRTLRIFQEAPEASGRLHIKGRVTIRANNDENIPADYSLDVQNNVNVGGAIHANGNISTNGQISAATLNVTGGLSGPGTIPVGGIIMWSGAIADIPAGWALCDGQSGRPDLRGRFIVGYHEGITEYNLTRKSGKGSADTTITLTVANLPAHDHAKGTLATVTAGSHNHTFTGAGGGGGSDVNMDNSGSSLSSSTNFAGSHTHDITGSTASTGSGTAFGNRPPWYVLAYIIRIN